LAEIRNSAVSGAINAYADQGTASAGGAAGSADSSRFYRIAVSGTIDAGVSKLFGGIATFSNFLYAGGIAGSFGGADSSVSPEIRECYNTGNVTGVSYAPNVGENSVYTGGIVGASGGWGVHALITDSYSRGNITAMTAPGFSGVNASFYAGGIAGKASGITIQNSYAAGIITADSNLAVAIYTHAGGIAAVLEGTPAGTITVQNSAALSPQINWRLYTKDDMILNRIAIRGVYVDPGVGDYFAKQGLLGQEMYPESTDLINNIANEDMNINYQPSTEQAAKVPPPIVPVSDPDGEDGEDAAAQPSQTVFVTQLGWDFNSVWIMGTDNYPALRNVP
jgi:hypothetical protein